jgi:hypothetical protein
MRGRWTRISPSRQAGPPGAEATSASGAALTGARGDRRRCQEGNGRPVDGLTAFGFIAVTLMLICYALEARSPWFVLAFAGACALGSAYGFLQGAWPFGAVEAVWTLIALRRWQASARKTPSI